MSARPVRSISLVVATLNRVAELERLLSSLEGQSYRDFEVIIVDQNADDRLRHVLACHQALSIEHLHAEPGGSNARNFGIQAAKGALISFPDDDCWYPFDLLASVVSWFSDHPEFDGLFACLRDSEDRPIGPKWPGTACVCDRKNAWGLALTANGFLRSQVPEAIGLFNVQIGIGSKTAYQSGEDIDYFLRALESGYKLWFEPGLTVHHPNMHSPERLRRTTYGYALGGGYVQRIHGYSRVFIANQIIRSLGGAVVSLLRADFGDTWIYLLRAVGQFRGYFWGPRDLARQVHSAMAK